MKSRLGWEGMLALVLIGIGAAWAAGKRSDYRIANAECRGGQTGNPYACRGTATTCKDPVQPSTCEFYQITQGCWQCTQSTASWTDCIHVSDPTYYCNATVTTKSSWCGTCKIGFADPTTGVCRTPTGAWTCGTNSGPCGVQVPDSASGTPCPPPKDN